MDDLDRKVADGIEEIIIERDAALTELKEALDHLAALHGPIPSSFTALRQENEATKNFLRKHGRLPKEE